MTVKLVLALWLVLASATAAGAQTDVSAAEAWQADRSRVFDAGEVTLDDFRWIARPVVVFADSDADPRFRQQMEFLTARIEALALRDVVIIVDTDPAARSGIRTTLRPRGFMLAILAKDGTVVARKPLPWDVREISRSIDKLPLRQQEIRDGTAVGG
jgi:hypothetical protein